MPKFSLRTVLWTLAGLLAVVAFWLLATSPGARTQRAAEERRDAVGTVAGRTTLAVDSHRVEVSEDRRRIEVAGVLEALRRVEVAAEIAGQVIAIDADEHSAVEADALLARQDPALLEAALKRARAAVLRAEAGDQLARAEWRRQRDLAERGVTSSADLDRAESEAKDRAAAVAEAGAALEEAGTRLERTQIRAPFAGIVTKLDLDVGAYLRPGDVVAEVADLSEIEIEIGVSDSEILALAVGDPVEVRVQALPNERFAGRVAALGRSANTATRKYPVPVRVPNPELRLLPGMQATLAFEIGSARPTLIVPRRAVIREFDLDYVFVLEPTGEGRALARRRRVATRALAFRPEVIEIISGLAPNEVVATTGVREIRDGQPVRVRGGSVLLAPPTP